MIVPSHNTNYSSSCDTIPTSEVSTTTDSEGSNVYDQSGCSTVLGDDAYITDDSTDD